PMQQYPNSYQNPPQGSIPQQQYPNPPQNRYPYPYQNPQAPQNVNLPEDNGSNGETSRFGAVWDRNVNGNRDNGNQNNDNNRW
ncbi:MAG: hypothetical protein K2G55_00990, partial [Lachnospiraceae bacterium]|nr:hypothetical protein [Lachnospiraceae bacterium]